jgi:hypothetical protein
VTVTPHFADDVPHQPTRSSRWRRPAGSESKPSGARRGGQASGPAPPGPGPAAWAGPGLGRPTRRAQVTGSLLGRPFYLSFNVVGSTRRQPTGPAGTTVEPRRVTVRQ